MTQKSFDEFFKSFTEDQCSTAEGLARELLQAKLLTRYQLQLISQGMGQLLSFGDYVLQERIGSGGMGTVYRAIHTKMNRSVAIKILNPKLSGNPALLERFDREVRATAKLQHINIVHAYDAGEYNQAHFLVMELVEGVDLNRVISEKGPLSVRHALECIRQVAEGLKYAHAQGIIHRDVKPSNILLSRSGVVKLSDMGLVRVSRDWDDSDVEQFNDNLSRTGIVMGSVNFMAPEQAMDSRDTDERSDIYSLGATLYYLLTGNTMFSADTATKTILAMQTTPTPSLQDVREDISDQVEALFHKLVARQPEERFRTMGHLLDAIKNCGESENETTRHAVPKATPIRIPGSLLNDSSLSQDFWDRPDEPSDDNLLEVKYSINVLDDDSIHEETDDPTLMQMMPRKPDSELMESSILQEVTRSHRRAMLLAIIPLSVITLYFFARSLQQTPANTINPSSLGISSGQYARNAELRELIPDLEEEVWTVLIPEKPRSDAKAHVAVDGDGFMVVTGDDAVKNRFRLSSPVDASRITGVRLEVDPASEIPNEADGRSEPGFRLTGFELQTRTGKSNSPGLPARFRSAYADYYQSLTPSGDPLIVSHAIDGNPETAWGVGGLFRLPHWAVFETDPNSVAPQTKQITLALEFGRQSGPSEPLRRFRILVTDKPRPMLQEMVRRGNLSEIEKRASAFLIQGNPREASDLLQSAITEGAFESGTRLVLLAIAFQDQLLIGPARKTSEELARWLKENRTGHPLLLSLAEHVLVEIGGLDQPELERILAGCKLEYQVAAWTAKLKEIPPEESQFCLRRRAEAYARLGQWKRAASDSLKVSRGGEVEDRFHLQTLIALVASGDLETYREFCAFLSETKSPPAGDTAFSSWLREGFLLQPDGASFSRPWLEHFDREVSRLEIDSPALPRLLAFRALAHYRSNQPQEALNAVQRSLDAIESTDETVRLKLASIRSLSLSVRALASLELGNSREAENAVREAGGLIPTVWKQIVDPAQSDAVVHEGETFALDWVIAAILLRQAETGLSARPHDSDSDDSRVL